MKRVPRKVGRPADYVAAVIAKRFCVPYRRVRRNNPLQLAKCQSNLAIRIILEAKRLSVTPRSSAALYARSGPLSGAASRQAPRKKQPGLPYMTALTGCARYAGTLYASMATAGHWRGICTIGGT
jgi:hypothetical protein